MWELYQQATKFNTTPSKLLGFEDYQVEAYCLNRAIYLFGTSLEDEIQTQTKKLKQAAADTKARQILYKWIAKPGEIVKGTYRDPAIG